MHAQLHQLTDWVELDGRSGDGLEVTLLWRRRDDAVALRVFDTVSGEVRGGEVPADCACDAIARPFAYLTPTDDAPAKTAAAHHEASVDVDELWLSELAAEVVAGLTALLARTPPHEHRDGEDGV